MPAPLGAPPSLKPLPSPAVLLPETTLPFENAQQLSIVTTSSDAKKSQPSSALFQARQPRNTLPGPMRSLAAKPSAFSPMVGWSRFSYESQLSTRLLAAFASLVASDDDAVICRPVSEQLWITSWSKVLFEPLTAMQLSPARWISKPRKTQ